MFRQSKFEWIPSSVKVEGNIESDHPTWVMTAIRGRTRIDLASGPLSTRKVAERFAVWMNDQDPASWDAVIQVQLPDVLRGDWG